MAIEQQPRTRVARQLIAIQARQEALRSVDARLTALQRAAADLRLATLWSPTQALTSGNESVLTARRLAGAYAVTVAAMATADARTYAWTAGGGDLTIDYEVDGEGASKAFA